MFTKKITPEILSNKFKNEEEPLRAELYSMLQMEQHGKESCRFSHFKSVQYISLFTEQISRKCRYTEFSTQAINRSGKIRLFT